MPSTARLLSSAFVIEPANVSTPRSTSQSGIEVAMTRTSLAPSSINWRTRCEPRKPVPPVMRVTARWRFSIAARRFVPGVTVVMRAVRLPGVLVGILLPAISHAAAQRRNAILCAVAPLREKSLALNRNLLGRKLFLALASPQLPRCLRVEFMTCPVTQVHDLVPDTRGDQPVRLSPRKSLRHLFQLFDLQQAPDPRADLAALDDRRTFRHCLVRAVEVYRQNPDARVQREIPNYGLEVSHDSRHRARAFREDERVVTTIEKRLRMTQRLPQRACPLHRHKVRKIFHHCALVLRIEEIIGSGKRHEVLPILTKRHLGQTHVQVRSVVRSDKEICMRRNI